MKKNILVTFCFIIVLTITSFLFNKNSIVTEKISYKLGYQTKENYYQGETTSLKLKKKGTISYDESSYSCTIGKTIDTVITAEGYEGNYAVVKSFRSSNKNVASIEKNPDMAVRCINCVAVRITCKNKGKVTLYATSTDGATTRSSLEVEDDNYINFDQTSYSCSKGEIISTLITTSPYSRIGGMRSYNNTIATIESSKDIQTNCSDCILAKIKCKRAGTTRLSATSTTGATQTVTITVR